jgi:hypothetical protein
MKTWVSYPQTRHFQVAKNAQDRRPLGVPNGKTPVPCHVVIGMWQDVARCGKMWQDMMWQDVARCAKNPQYAFHYIPNFVHIVYMLAVMSAG